VSENACGEPQWFYDKYLNKDDHKEEMNNLERRCRQLEHKLLANQLIAAREDTLRQENPALMDLWDKYQTMCKLVENNEQNDND